jgi:hypothetical protein
MSLATTITAAVGQLSGAAGQVLGGMSAGTAECGARPILAKNRDEWNACVARNTTIREQNAAAMDNRSAETQTNPLLIIGVVVVVIVVLVMIFRKK